MKIWVLNAPFMKKFSRPQRSPAVTKSGTLYFPIWLAYCTGVLEEAGHDVTLTDAPARGVGIQETLKLAGDMKPGLIVMDTSTPSIANDSSVAAQLKEKLPQTFIVMVGTHVSALAEETLSKSPAVDAIARKEYEYTIRDLAALLASGKGGSPDPAALEKIAGLSFRTGDRIVHTPDRTFIENLDELPWVSKVYKKFLRIEDYFNANALYPMVTLVTSRGCPFRCNFCVYPQVLTGRRYRFRGIEDVLDEMEYAIQQFPQAKSVFFEDDTLTANKNRCMEFADAIIRRGIKFPWTANSRIEMDLQGLKRIAEAGCRELCVGFESGDQNVLNTMRKGTNTEKMLQFVKDAKEAHILIHGCFMVGFPGETRESIEKTTDLAIQLSPDTVQFYPVMVYPGTEAYDEYKQKGWITAQEYKDWLTPEGLHNCVVRNENFTSAELVRFCDEARKRFYLRPGYMAYKAGQMLQHPREISRTLKSARTFAKYLIRGSDV